MTRKDVRRTGASNSLLVNADMALITCPECEARISDKAHSCPSCGYPMMQTPSPNGKSAWPGVVGGVAGTYISAQMLASIIVGSVAMISFAAIMIALVMQ